MNLWMQVYNLQADEKTKKASAKIEYEIVNVANNKADQVGAEQSAEEHDFGGEEDPHAETGGVALLLLGGEVMQEGRVSGVSFAVNVALDSSC